MAIPQALRFNFLRVSQVQCLNGIIEGPKIHVHDIALLESALHSPINQNHYSNENDLAQLTAALSVKLIRNHAFLNGNKRTALLAANLFLLQHNMRLQVDAEKVEKNDMIEEAHCEVADDRMEQSNWRESIGYRGKLPLDITLNERRDYLMHKVSVSHEA
ncbi:hypothetical protein BDR22DRAFT_901400 [Usnea florida]